MSLSLLLSVIATAFAGHYVPVHCEASPTHPWAGNDAGRAAWTYGTDAYDRIYLRNCRHVVALRRPWVDNFAHEILHIAHKSWAHPRIYAAQHSYGAVVLKEIRRLR